MQIVTSNRKIQFSVTNFLYVDDEYLMLHRTGDVTVDKNKLNGIGGKLEEGENFLDAAIRETEEETGYIVPKQDIKFSGIIKLTGGYPEDWVMCFFKIKVFTKKIPHGNNIREGELMWIHKDRVLDAGYELVDDLHYCWKDVVSGNQFFITEKVNGKEKIEKISKSTLFSGKLSS